jgi:hypothetical protein
LDKLNFYSNEGKKFLIIAKKSNDKTILKYSLFLYQKSNSLVQSIENGEQIDSITLSSNFAKFDEYLQKLNESSNVPSAPESTIPTPPEQS